MLLCELGCEREAEKLEVRVKTMRAKHPEWDAQRQLNLSLNVRKGSIVTKTQYRSARLLLGDKRK